MKQKAGEGDRRIKAFAEALLKASGRDTLPEGMSGDFADLLFTLEGGVLLLTEFMNGNFPPNEWAARLTAIEILLSSDIPMIVDDILPALKVVEDDAYARLDDIT